MAQAGTIAQVVPERVLTLPALRDRNLIFFGRPEYSKAAGLLLDGLLWSVAFDSETNEYAIFRRKSKESPLAAIYRQRSAQQGRLSRSMV